MHLVGRHRAGPRSCSVSEDRTAGAGGILTAIFSHPADKRTESGLSEFGYRNPIRGSSVRTPVVLSAINMSSSRR